MDSIKDFMTDWSIMGAILKIVMGAFPFLIILIRKLVNLRKDMEELKSIIDEDKKQVKRDRANAKEDMEYAKKYRDEAREDKMAIEQIREEVRREKNEIQKIAQAINSQDSSLRARKTPHFASDKTISRGTYILGTRIKPTTPDVDIIDLDVRRMNALTYFEHIMAKETQSSETDREDFKSFSKFLNYLKRRK